MEMNSIRNLFLWRLCLPSWMKKAGSAICKTFNYISINLFGRVFRRSILAWSYVCHDFLQNASFPPKQMSFTGCDKTWNFRLFASENKPIISASTLPLQATYFQNLTNLNIMINHDYQGSGSWDIAPIFFEWTHRLNQQLN